MHIHIRTRISSFAASCNDVNTPLCDQVAVDQKADELAALLAENSPYDADTSTLPCLLPSMLEVGTVRAAAKTSPVGTGLGVANLFPRALRRLSDDVLYGLCLLYAAVEGLVNWPTAGSLVVIALLRKSDGGRRPVGLFPDFIRIWMRARVDLVRRWEAAHALPCIYGGVGMGAQRAVWQVAFCAESAASGGLEYGRALLDLVKAFEKIPHRHLFAAAVKHGYDCCLLRLCLAAYRLARSIGIDGVYSRMVIAVLSITAGSGSATSELRLLMIDVVSKLARSFPPICITLCVDDLTLVVAHEDHTEMAARTFVRYVCHKSQCSSTSVHMLDMYTCTGTSGTFSKQVQQRY